MSFIGFVEFNFGGRVNNAGPSEKEEEGFGCIMV